MKKTSFQKTGELLVDLYRSNYPILSEYQWEWEHDRWKELLVCVLIGQKITPTAARRLIDLLEEFQGIDPQSLARKSNESRKFIYQTMMKLGFKPDVAQKAAQAVILSSILVTERWGGYLQRFLRYHGIKMVNEFSDYLIAQGFESKQARMTATLWLQNVANLPILNEQNEYVRKFSRENEIDANDLLELSDQLGINLSILDELLLYQHNTSNSKSNAQRKNEVPKAVPKKSEETVG